MSSRDTETRRAIEQLTRELAKTQRRVDTLQRGARGPHLAHSSTDGSVAFTDPKTERVKLRIGRQSDGKLGLVATDGDPPPAPSDPIVTPSMAGLRVGWDGEFSGGQARPSDFDRVAVHVSTDEGFEASAATYVGSITQAGDGGILPVVPLPYTEHYVRLVGVNSSGVGGVASGAVAATPHQVEGPDLVAGSVTAGHIAAGAVEADKLAGLIVLASRLVAGDAAGARVELNEDGLRAYNSSEELTVSVDAEDGSAVYSGDITGSTITGSEMTVGDPAGAHAVIGPEAVEQTFNSVPGLAVYGSEGSVVQLAGSDSADVRLHVPSTTDEEYEYAEIEASEQESGGAAYPRLSVSAPRNVSRALSRLVLSGGSEDVEASHVEVSGDVIELRTPVALGAGRGVIEIGDWMSFRSPAHVFHRTELANEPTSTTTGNGDWNAFTESEFPSLSWRTGMSGRVRITIMMCGANPSSDNSSLSTSFRLTGGSTVEPELHRAAFVRSAGDNIALSRQSCQVVYLQLAGDAIYELVPYWRTSGSTPWGGSNQYYDLALDNSITIENLM